MVAETVKLKCLSASFLNLILMPTEACNFRCTYCYETFEHKKMSPSVVNGIKSLIERRAGDLDKLLISWFGGEPLLAYDLITDISRHAIAVAKAHGFEFSADMTTNGYFLDRERLMGCLESGVQAFQISLDGDEDLHNASRRLASGAGTFDRIWSNLTAMKDTEEDFTVLMRLHYTFENFLSVAAAARRVNDAFGDDSRFQVYFRNIKRMGGPNDDCITVLSEVERRDIEAQLWSLSGLQQSEDESDEEAAEEGLCYACKGNSLVVRSTGRLGKCTVALTDDFNDIGSLSENGEVSIDQAKFVRWIAPVIEERWEDAKCPLSAVAYEAELAAQTQSAPALAQA